MVAGCLALQLSGTLHLALAEHRICAEHGEAIDVAESASATLSLEQHGEPARRAAVSVQHERSEQPHDHCPVANHSHGRALVVQSAACAQCVISTTIAEPNARYANPSASTLRLLAPKTSPPA
jgi:hypothetical protein